MVSRNNKRTRNKNNKHRNKKSRNKRERHKKSMNRYKRSLKKKKSRRNYKKRTINKKLQRGGVIQIQFYTVEGWHDYGKQMEETFDKKHKQFYNAFVYRLFKIDTPILKKSECRFVSDTPTPVGTTDTIFNVPAGVGERTDGPKIGLARHSESEANWLLPGVLDTKYGTKYEVYYGYVTAFLTPYGRALAYSTGYYEYGDHILTTRENLEFYSSTLPRSMITAMLMLRGVIQRLRDITESASITEYDLHRMVQKGGDKRMIMNFVEERLQDLIRIYNNKTVRVVYGCSEEPVGGTLGLKGGIAKAAHKSVRTGNYAQRIMDAKMLQPMMEFISATECGGTNIKLEWNNSEKRPYLWRNGDEETHYLSNHETLDRFFHALSNIKPGGRLGDTGVGTGTLPEDTRHIAVVHGIIMEKYISWPFFTEYFQDFIPNESITAAMTGTGKVGIFMNNLLTYIRDQSKTLHERLSKVLFWGGFELDTINHMIEVVGNTDELTVKLEGLSNTYRSLIAELQENISIEGDARVLRGLNLVLNQIGDPRCTDDEWFREYESSKREILTDTSKEPMVKTKGDGGRENTAEALQRYLMDGPLNKTPFNCCTVMFTFNEGRTDQQDYEDSEKAARIRDNIRNLHLLQYCRDVKFLAPSLVFRVCPPADAGENFNYQKLLDIMRENKPNLTNQTDDLIMNSICDDLVQVATINLSKDILFECNVLKKKKTTVRWPKVHLVIRGKGVYFYEIPVSGGLGVESARGSSCHNIRYGIIEQFTETHTIELNRQGLESIRVKFHGDNYTGKDGNEYSNMEFSFFDVGERDECLRHLQRITGQLIEDEVAGEAEAVGAAVDAALVELEPEPELEKTMPPWKKGAQQMYEAAAARKKVGAVGAVGPAVDAVLVELEHEPKLMDDAVLVEPEPEPPATDDNASQPIVARGYVYKKGQGHKAFVWPRLYIVLKGKGIYFYESEEEFLGNNPEPEHNILKGKERSAPDYVQEESHIALKGFRGSSTHDITSGLLQPLGIEKTGGTGGRLNRAKIEIKFNPPYTSADPSKESGDFRSDEIIFSVLGYHDTKEEANKNSEVEIFPLPNTKGELMRRLHGDRAIRFADPPFFVLLYNKIWGTLNPHEETKMYV